MIRICYIDASNKSIESLFLKGVSQDSSSKQIMDAITILIGSFSMHQLHKDEWFAFSKENVTGENTFYFKDEPGSPIIPGPYQKALTIHIYGKSLRSDDSSYIPSELQPLIEWKIGQIEKRETVIDKILS